MGVPITARRCQLCGSILYGRSDKRYCSSTCRRDASRVRERPIRLGGFEFYGREWRLDKVEAVLIPKLERLHGPNHKSVHDARHLLDQLRDKELEELERALKQMSWW